MYLVTQETALVGNLKTTNGGIAVQSKRATVAYTDATAKDLFTLPAGAIPLAIFVDVATGFTDTGTDLLAVGKTGTAGHFFTGLDVAATGRKAPTLGNLGVSVGSAAITVIGTFTGQNGNAGAGSAVVTCLFIMP